eukprot:4613354-Pleurochrysis_carterae.AAC.3
MVVRRTVPTADCRICSSSSSLLAESISQLRRRSLDDRLRGLARHNRLPSAPPRALSSTLPSVAPTELT